MRKILVIFSLLFFTTTAQASNTLAPLTSGTIHIKFGAVSNSPDSLPTASISVRRMDTLESVYCENVAPDGIAEGDTNVILNDTQQILLEGVAWSDPGCTGIASLGSLDRYHVIFAAPGRPVLLPL